MQTWEKLLSDRGILGEAVAQGWHPSGNGWRYPVFDKAGNQSIVLDEKVYRWKAFDSGQRPKYLWHPSDMGKLRPVYYMPPGTLDAITVGHAEVLLASGEPDVLAFRAAGAKNVICWFGEGDTPDCLAIDLMNMGVRVIECYPDRDEKGLQWAQAIATNLQGSGIRTRIYELPGVLGSKFDVNQLWIDCKFDETCFWDTLIRCAPIDVQPLPKLTSPLTPLSEFGEDMPADYYAAIERELGVKDYQTDGWSKPILCPFHNDKEPSAGWHKEKHILKCFVCNKTNNDWYLAKVVAEILGVDYHNYLPQKPVVVKPAPAAPRAQPTGKPSIVKSWNEATDKLMAQLDGDVPVFEPLSIPFRSIANHGGFAKRMPPGKMIAIVGDSGMGKTSLIETIVDSWRKSGFHGVLWGPEWSHEQYVQRGIQRQGGPSFERIEDHKANLSEVKRGVPAEKLSASRLTPTEFTDTKFWAAHMKAWPGGLSFVDKMSLPIEAVIKNMIDTVAAYAADGRRVAFAVLDYAQLIGAHGESETARLNHVLDTFKAFCVDKQLVGLVGSQMTKFDGRAAASGTKGSLHSMVSARSDVFNLALVITREVKETGEASKTANCRIVKNSTGKTGDVSLYLHPERLSWHDVAPE